MNQGKGWIKMPTYLNYENFVIDMTVVKYIGTIATLDQQPSTQLFVRDEQRLSLGDLLAVNNNNISPPIIVQNRRNKHTFSTYACTINLVPLVLEKTCFAGHIQIQAENE